MPDHPPEISTPAEDARRRRTGLIFVGFAVGAVGFTMAMQMGLNDNFLAGILSEGAGESGFEKGVLEAWRETCGIVALGLLALLAGLAEPIVAAGMLVLVAVGIAGYAYVQTYTWLIVASLVWSQGLHVWMPLPQSMTLALAEPGRAGFRLGQVRSAGAAGCGIGIFVAYALTKWCGVSIRPLFLVAAVAAVMGAMACLGVPRKIKTPGPRLVFKREYGLYYLLSFLEGWRKQIFVCFAGFLLVKVHNTPVTTILLLHGCVQVISFVVSPMVGRQIDRLGERRILVFYFSCLTLFFIGYAVIPSRTVLFVLFVVDSAFFVFATALTTYVSRLAPPGEHTATLSMGVAMNHIAAVAMPIAGGIAWARWGHKWAFILGAIAAAISVFVAMRVPDRPEPERAESS